MIAAAVEDLLERLSRGELSAAEELLPAYAAYLRAVVRRSLPERLQAKFDSSDVIQSVWVHVLQGLRTAEWRFDGGRGLKALLVTLARRRLISRVRHHAPAVAREEVAGDGFGEVSASPEPSPSEVVQADELWERMLMLCPPEHHELLRLRRQGLTLTEIAGRTGLHEGSVRRIFRRLAKDLMLHDAPLDSSPSRG